jgi:hypothetical protein
VLKLPNKAVPASYNSPRHARDAKSHDPLQTTRSGFSATVRLRRSVGSPKEQVHQFLRPLNLRLPKPRPLPPLLIALLPGRPRAPLPLGPQRRHRLALLRLRVVPARRRSCRRRLRPWPRPRVALVQGGAERALARTPARCTCLALAGYRTPARRLAGCRCNLFVWIRY